MHQLQKPLEKMLEAIQEMKEIISNEEKVVKVLKTKEKPQKEVVYQETSQEDEVQEFEKLKSLLNSEEWPESVDPELICDPNSVEQKETRGKGVIDIMTTRKELEDKKFLDFGCGEGFATIEAVKRKTKTVIGYDLKEYSTWKENEIFTTDWSVVEENGPYDTILCFEVFDHVKEETVEEILEKMKSVLTEEGTIHLRTHPWTSRHANHFYHYLNKAYIHLVFTEEELQKLHPEWGKAKEFEESIKFTQPIRNYKECFEKAGLESKHQREFKEPVEEFFEKSLVSKRITENVGIGRFPDFQMSLQFIDWVIGRV